MSTTETHAVARGRVVTFPSRKQTAISVIPPNARKDDHLIFFEVRTDLDSHFQRGDIVIARSNFNSTELDPETTVVVDSGGDLLPIKWGDINTLNSRQSVSYPPPPAKTV